MKHTVCEQVLAVILVRQQHMPGCFFQKGSQETSERRRAKLPLSVISLLLLSVISCHYSVLLMSDPERQFISLLSDTRCMSVQIKNSVRLGMHPYHIFFLTSTSSYIWLVANTGYSSLVCGGIVSTLFPEPTSAQ